MFGILNVILASSSTLFAAAALSPPDADVASPAAATSNRLQNGVPMYEHTKLSDCIAFRCGHFDCFYVFIGVNIGGVWR